MSSASLAANSSSVASTAPACINVLVVDDSAVVRGLITRFLESDPQVKVVGSAAHGEAALTELGRRAVDVVVLDIEMPILDGLAALPRILAAHPQVKVLIASSLTRRGAEISLKCLSLGASDYVAKPDGSLVQADDFHRELLAKVKLFGRSRVAASPLRVAPAATQAASVRPASAAPRVLAIGASTGGPPALLKLFEALKGAVPQPILLTQHMPPTFTGLLAEQLARAGGRPAAEAVDGERILPGRTYVAPGGYHMLAAGSPAAPVIRLTQDPPENFCRPAVDPMFRSVAQVFGPGALGLILTGMGSDGAKGCEALAAAGGRFAVQDEATSVVWGMPGAAAGTGLANAVLPLGEIAGWIRLKTSVSA